MPLKPPMHGAVISLSRMECDTPEIDKGYLFDG